MSGRDTQTPWGLPERLPDGEVVLWQGQPQWRSLALRVFHVRKIAIYFGIILAWRVALGLSGGFSPMSAMADSAWLLLLALNAVGIPALLAWLYGRTTVYTVTDRRVVLRYGAALPVTLNLPFRAIGAASAKVHRDGTADIPLALAGQGRVSYLHLWPHARPWRLSHPEPMLRSVPDGSRVAALLAEALAAAQPADAVSGHAVERRDDRPAALEPAAA